MTEKPPTIPISSMTTVLYGSDGRRWLTFYGSGQVVELSPVDPPKKIIGKRK